MFRPEVSEHLNFRKTVAALAADHEIQPCPLTGIIHEIVVHFPAGCEALFAVRVYHGGRQILPRSGDLALDDATQPFTLAEPVKLGDPIRVDWENHDGAYSHTISVVVGVRGRR